MSYKSYFNEVKAALEKSKKEICQEIGVLGTAEAQMRTPVLTGNLRRSETFEVMENNEGVNIGVAEGVPYAVAVEKGDSRHRPQPYLEPAIMDNISKFEEIAQQKISANMGGE